MPIFLPVVRLCLCCVVSEYSSVSLWLCEDVVLLGCGRPNCVYLGFVSLNCVRIYFHSSR